MRGTMGAVSRMALSSSGWSESFISAPEWVLDVAVAQVAPRTARSRTRLARVRSSFRAGIGKRDRRRCAELNRPVLASGSGWGGDRCFRSWVTVVLLFCFGRGVEWGSPRFPELSCDYARRRCSSPRRPTYGRPRKVIFRPNHSKRSGGQRRQQPILG